MNQRIFLAFFIALCMGLAFTSPLKAQNKDAALLPDIDPQDIEIRGEFRARFPGLNRQPILGFDPNLRIYQIDPNRKPFMETGDQVVANLPVSELSRPAPPAYRSLQYADDIYTFTRVGVGSYTSPEVQFWGAYPINKGSYIGGDLDFSSSDGHLDNQPSSFRFLTAHGEFGTQLDGKTNLRLHGGVQSDFNHPADFSNGNTNLQPSDRIEYQGFNGGIEVDRFTNAVQGWKLQGNIRTFDTQFNTQILPGSINELVYNGSFSYRLALGNPSETLTFKAGGRGGNYEPGDFEKEQWGTLQGGLAYERLFNYQTQLHAEADVYYATNSFEDNIYPGGLLRVDHWIGDRLKITGMVEGKPYLKTVEQLHETNRFLGYYDYLRHTYSVDVTGEASVKYYRGSKIHGGVTYTNAQDYGYFVKGAFTNDLGVSLLDFYNINYKNATNFKLFAGITHQLLPERFWVSGQFYLQNPELDNGDDVPFEENWGVNASMSFRPIDRITIEGWADYVGKRKTGVADNEVDGFLLVGSQLDAEITDNFGAYLKLVNILGQEYQVWQGYQERPFQVYGGLTLKF